MAVVDPGGLLQPEDLAGFGPVIPVIVIDQVDKAVPMARALVDGGIRVLEVTLRKVPAPTPARRRRPARASASARATAPRSPRLAAGSGCRSCPASPPRAR